MGQQKLFMAMAVLFFCLFIVLFAMKLAAQPFEWDFWFYTGAVAKIPPNALVSGASGYLGMGHDLTLILSWSLVRLGYAALPAFFGVSFVFSSYYMVRPLSRFAFFTFAVAPFSLTFLSMVFFYSLFGQLFSMSLFLVAVGLYLRKRRTPVALFLSLSVLANVWVGTVLLFEFGLFLAVKNRRFLAYTTPAIVTLFLDSPGGMFNVAYLVSSTMNTSTSVTLIASPLKLLIMESLVVWAFSVYGVYRMRKSDIGLLLFLSLVMPVAGLALMYSFSQNFRILFFIPFIPLSAIGISKFIEYLLEKYAVPKNTGFAHKVLGLPTKSMKISEKI